jgi:hypothetical protein
MKKREIIAQLQEENAALRSEVDSLRKLVCMQARQRLGMPTALPERRRA